ncbi:MAG: D-alanyl-D-alanine carboxypeptidase family protein, partial [Candidatus Dormibacteraceae bacterium]
MISGSQPALPWPSRGAAAVGLPGLGILGSNGDSTPLPIASMAKVMTAYIVLRQHPLQPGQDGPPVTVQPDDVATYRSDLAQGQSVVAVQAGEQLSERQLLEGLLIPSGNNLATLLGRWVAGSAPAMVAKANMTAARLGLSHTHFSDLSGFDPGTVSTPTDMIRLGEAAMADPLFAHIVGMPAAVLPLAGTVSNVDYVLGQDGIIGVKTGSDTPAGGCFLFAAQRQASGRRVTIYGAVMGQPTLDGAFNASKALIDAVAGGIKLDHVLSANQSVGRYRAPWGGGSD